MIGFYNYTVILTYVSLIVSSLGICFAGVGKPYHAIFCLILSGICDMFDGKIARTRKHSTAAEKRFGIQIDSLCDLVCFGVLPAVIGIQLATPDPELVAAMPYIDLMFEVSRIRSLIVLGYAVWVLGALLILCALIRLAYFNVTEEMRQDTVGGRRTSFEGLPVTSAAIIFPFAFIVSRLCPSLLSAWVYPVFMLVTAVCFITPFKVSKPHKKGLIVMSAIGLAEIAGLIYLMVR